MKPEEYIKSIFNEIPQSCEYIPTGLTNDNYKVVLKNKTVVLRIPRAANQDLFDYGLEALILEKIKPFGLDSQLLYYNKISGVKCNEYVENAHYFKPEYIERAALLIRRLHDTHLVVGKGFDVRAKFHQYKTKNHAPLFDTGFAHHVIEEIELHNVRLCHNDLVLGNLLFTPSHDYLIDYEYAADNDPFFDVMSFITENDIQDPLLRERFYTVYFDGPPSSKQRERLHKFELIHHVLWCEWAMMMYDMHKDPVYKEIAALKYQRLLECY